LGKIVLIELCLGLGSKFNPHTYARAMIEGIQKKNDKNLL